ncbi:MAG: trigger factor [Candidatus Omnitrophica bacterium]|nr:trigger factor [Candidatus Omnitrophota bacterium]
MKTLKVSVQDGKVCEKILTIEVGREDIQKEYEEFYQAVSPKAKIPGFRPGKAPRDVIAMHFKNEAREEVLKHLISESYRNALQEKSLEPLGYPNIKDVNFDEQKLSYRAQIEIRPKVKISRAAGLAAKKEAVQVANEEVEQALKSIQQSFAQFKVVEDRAAAMGDFLIADYVCFVDGKEAEKRTDDWFEIREEEFLKGFSKQLVGSKPGDEKEVQITFPESMSRKELAGKPALFKVKVKEIKVRNLPELNDDLARDAGEYQTLAELRAKIEKDILSRKEHEKEAAFEKALLDEFLKHNKIDLPEGLVKRRAEYLLERSKQDFLHQGHSEEEFEKNRATLLEDLQPEAKRQVHLAFLLDELAAKENITVTDEDLKTHYAQLAGRVRQPVEEVEKYYHEHEDAKESMKDQVRSEKVIEWIKKNSKQK